jgi:hypothetical protein
MTNGCTVYLMTHLRADSVEETACTLQYCDMIRSPKTAATRPFSRDVRIDTSLLSRESTRLEAELEIAVSAFGYNKRLPSTNVELGYDHIGPRIFQDLLAKKTEEKEKEKREEDERVRRLIDAGVRERFSELNSKYRSLHEESEELSSRISYLSTQMASSKEEYASRLEELRAEEVSVHHEKESVLAEIESLKEEEVAKRAQSKDLESKMAGVDREVREDMARRNKEHEGVTKEHEEERKRRGVKRVEWTKMAERVAPTDVSELCIVRDPHSKDMLSGMKKWLQGLKMEIDEYELSLEPMEDELKVHQVAVRHVETRPVDWSTLDEERRKEKQAGLLKEAEGKEKQLQDLIEQVVLFLQHGVRVQRYRKFGKPSTEHMFISPDRVHLCWCSPSAFETPTKRASSKSGVDSTFNIQHSTFNTPPTGIPFPLPLR